jgi:hypothetical protein
VKVSLVGLLLVLVLSFAGCSTTPHPILPIPESLESASLIEVKRNRSGLGPRPMRFGEWQVNGFDRKGFPGNRSWSIGNDDVSYSQSRGWAAYSFRLTPEAREEWECDCRFKKSSRSAGLGKPGDAFEVTLTYDDSLRCDLWREGDDEPWKLVVYGSLFIGGEGYSGILARGDRTLVLEPNHRITGLGRLPGPPLGYLFLRGEQEVAAAELIRPGFVRIDDAAAEDRDAVATAIAALMMQPAGF